MEFFVIVLIYAAWMLISAASRKDKKNKPGGKNAAGRTAARTTGRVSAAPLKKMESGMQAWLDKNPQAPAQAEPQKTVPQTAEPERPAVFPQALSAAMPASTLGRPGNAAYSGSLGNSAYSGSLAASEPEGTDPCHDDYSSMSSGSLPEDSEEGKDPCHDGWEPAASSRQTPAENGEGGLGLNWTGNELVKGFIYGEILKRKAG